MELSPPSPRRRRPLSGATEYTGDTSGNGLSLASPAGTMHFGTEGGKFGGYLAGSSSTPLQVSSPLLAPAQLTLLAWIKQSGYPGTLRYIAGRGNDGPTCSGSSYALYTGYSAIAGLHFYIRQPDAGATSVITDSPPDSAVFDGNWHLVAGTYDGTAIRLFVDGVQVGPAEPATGIGYDAPINDPSFYVGGYPPQAFCGTSDFPGQIDEVRVYERALTASELQRLAVATGPAVPELVPDAGPPTPSPSVPTGPSSSPATGTGTATPPTPLSPAWSWSSSSFAQAGKSISGASRKPPGEVMQTALEAMRVAALEAMGDARDNSLIGKPQKVTGLSAKEVASLDANARIKARLEAMKYGIGMRVPAAPGEVVEVVATIALEKVGKQGATTQTIVLSPAVGGVRGGQRTVPLEIPVDARAGAAMTNGNVAEAAISIEAVGLPSPAALGAQSTRLQQLLGSTESSTVNLSGYLEKLQEAEKKELEADRRYKDELASKAASEKVAKLDKQAQQIKEQISASNRKAADLMQGAVSTLIAGLVSQVTATQGAIGGANLPAGQKAGIETALNPCGVPCSPSGLITGLGRAPSK